MSKVSHNSDSKGAHKLRSRIAQLYHSCIGVLQEELDIEPSTTSYTIYTIL